RAALPARSGAAGRFCAGLLDSAVNPGVGVGVRTKATCETGAEAVGLTDGSRQYRSRHGAASDGGGAGSAGIGGMDGALSPHDTAPWRAQSTGGKRAELDGVDG